LGFVVLTGNEVISDEALMLAVKAGSRPEFEALFERYQDVVWRFFRRRVQNPGRAEELVQDVFVAILQGAARYEPRAPFRTYLFGIAYNLLLAERRSVARSEMKTLPDDVVSAMPDVEGTLWVRRGLATLAPDDREIVMLREYEGLSYAEIADVMQLPLNTVRSRLFRARMHLRDALSGELPIHQKVVHGSR
jgi:RNA polymerase sigma-70 factor (ECF subfamily)